MKPLAIAQLCFVAIALAAAPAAAQAPDTILVNGKILTVDAQFSTARSASRFATAVSSPSTHPRTSGSLRAARRASSTCRAGP